MCRHNILPTTGESQTLNVSGYSEYFFLIHIVFSMNFKHNDYAE